MNINTLITNFRNAVHDNVATQTWCTTAYGRNHHVYVGVDTRKPPGSDQYPLVHLFPLEKAAGGGDQVHVIGCTCGVYDADTRTVAGKTNLVELAGVQNLESFRKLVETALLTAALANGHYIDRIKTTYETIEFFPYFLTTMEVRVAAELGFEEDPYQ
jgi:hypothetical protein